MGCVASHAAIFSCPPHHPQLPLLQRLEVSGHGTGGSTSGDVRMDAGHEHLLGKRYKVVTVVRNKIPVAHGRLRSKFLRCVTYREHSSAEKPQRRFFTAVHGFVCQRWPRCPSSMEDASQKVAIAS